MQRNVSRMGRRWIGVLGCLLLAVVLPFTAQATVTASGGDMTSDSGAFRYHVFTNTVTGSFTVTAGGMIEVLVVGGGGGGGQTIAGGGGGGGLIHSNNVTGVVSNYSVIVGAGGLGGKSTSAHIPGLKGGDSVFGPLTALGGAGGAGYNQNSAESGGSGGGDGANTGKGGDHTEGQGNPGGTGLDNNFGAGGGGAGSAGTNAVTGFAGDGGAGLAFDISGSLTYYAGGGGGGVRSSSHGIGGEGGIGGGGAGSNTTGTNGDDNTGGGGGASGWENSYADAGDGGSGIVVVRYVIADSPLSVMNNPVTGIGTTNTTLNGRVGGTGGEPDPDVYFCWGPADGGTTSTGAWYRVIGIETRKAGEFFSHETFELDMGQDYFVRAYATNSAGQTAWSESQTFTTIYQPSVATDGAVGIGRYTTTLRGEITDTGGETPVSGFEWWPSVAGAPTTTVTVGEFDGVYSVELDGLSPDTGYAFRAWASNAAGKLWSAADTWNTLDMTPRIYSWTGTTDSDWHNWANWDLQGVPGDGIDTARLTNGAVLLTASTADLAAFEMTGGAFTFDGWQTSLTATNIDISGGTVTLPGPFPNAGPSNRVWFVCENFSLAQNAEIDADENGYAGGVNGKGSGLGAANASDARHGPGAGHGSFGGASASSMGGPSYGYAREPMAPGSGGWGPTTGAGGAGGGAVLIDATDLVTVNGTITANGGNGAGTLSGGGSGGSVLIRCQRFAATNGIIRANGGNYGDNRGGSGAGGRIAILYDSDAQQTMPPQPVLSLYVAPGSASTSTRIPQPDIGTIYLTDGRLLAETIDARGQLLFDTPWNPANLNVDSRWIRFPKEGYELNVNGSVAVQGSGGKLELGGSRFIRFGFGIEPWFFNTNTGPHMVVGGDMVVTNSGALYVFSGTTNDVNIGAGALVTVTGTLKVASGSWIYPHSHRLNGGSPRFVVGHLITDSGGGFNANALGWTGGAFSQLGDYNGKGSGRGVGGDRVRGTGAGYGGFGGISLNSTGGRLTYGDALMPIYCGSGGGGYDRTLGGWGGGLVRIEAQASITHNGTITANGQQLAPLHSGGGSGGGIYLKTPVFKGSNATAILRANGGNANGTDSGGGGGGGRIAVAYGDDYSDTVPPHRLVVSETAPSAYAGAAPSVALGTGYDDGAVGTVRFIRVLYPAGSLISVR